MVMRKFKLFILLAAAICCSRLSYAQEAKANEYLVIAGTSVQQDTLWNKVALELSKKHGDAPVIYYKNHPNELLKEIQKYNPRYVGIVEKPENLFRQYIIDLNLFSRTIDDDIYADFLWGIITGYDHENAMRMVKNSTEPLLMKSCVSTIMETDDGKWFDSYFYMDDQNKGIYGYKMPWENKTTKYSLNPQQIEATRFRRDGKVPNLLPLFYDAYAKIDPDVVITASHGSETALEMPFSAGFIRAKEGKLYAQFPEGDKFLVESGKRRVYLPIGNCLIGNIDSTKNSMAIAWMNSANVATYVVYVVTTWHGRNGWGGLKYLVTTPGRYTVAEAFYMNVQDMLYQMNEWYPALVDEPYPHGEREGRKNAMARIEKEIKGKPTMDQLGFWHDRDVVAFYGDPKWNVRLDTIEEENDFTVDTKIEGKKCTITIKTGVYFSPDKIAGDRFKQVHVLDIPFSHFFKERLNNPRLAEGQRWKVALDENFILIYGNRLRPNNTYTIVLDID